MEEDQLILEFPSIVEARGYVERKQYEDALDIYSEILEEAKTRHDEISTFMCSIYLEYSSTLISSFFASNFDKLQRLANRQRVNLSEDDNDLEIAWELLELCRITYTKVNDIHNLNRTYFLLGELLLNDNKIEEALEEYNKCMIDNEVLYRKALCYEFLNKFDESIGILRSINTDSKEFAKEISDEIKLLENKIVIPDIKNEIEKKIKDYNENDVLNIDSLVKKK